jgi:hypothetical protein
VRTSTWLQLIPECEHLPQSELALQLNRLDILEVGRPLAIGRGGLVAIRHRVAVGAGNAEWQAIVSDRLIRLSMVLLGTSKQLRAGST